MSAPHYDNAARLLRQLQDRRGAGGTTQELADAALVEALLAIFHVLQDLDRTVATLGRP